MNKGNVFKMRLELVTDAFKFLETFFRETVNESAHIQIDKGDCLGGTLTIATTRSKDFVKQIIDSCEDLHVMCQTLEPISSYTGIRK